MPKRIVILGSGYTGLRLAREATKEDYEVVGTTRSEETIADLEQVGVRGLLWDVLEDDAERLSAHIDRSTAVVYSIPTLFRRYEPTRDGRARHVKPVRRMLDVALENNADRFIYLSSTSVYGDHGGDWVDESTPTNPSSPYGKMRRDIEEEVLSVEADTAVDVARLVGIYGPGRTMLDYVKTGRYRLVDGGTKPSNRIHVDDIVESLLAMIDRGPKGARLYNVSDGHPKSVVEVVDWLVEHVGVPRPPEVTLEEYAEMRGPNAAARWKNTYRVRNDRLLDELGVELRYPDVFAGYESIFG